MLKFTGTDVIAGAHLQKKGNYRKKDGGYMIMNEKTVIITGANSGIGK